MKYSHFSEQGETEVKQFRERLLKEGRLLEEIRHDNIVKIYDIGLAGEFKIAYPLSCITCERSFSNNLHPVAPVP